MPDWSRHTRDHPLAVATVVGLRLAVVMPSMAGRQGFPGLATYAATKVHRPPTPRSLVAGP